MELVYVVGALVVAVLLLFFLVYRQQKQTGTLTGDIHKLYTDAAEQLKQEIDAKNTVFKEQVNDEVLQRLKSAGITKQQIDDLSNQTSVVQQTVIKLQSDVKDAALQHVNTLQSLVDSRMQLIQDKSDQLISDIVSRAQQQQQSSIEAITGQQTQSIVAGQTAFAGFQQQSQQLFDQQSKALAAQYQQYTDGLNDLGTKQRTDLGDQYNQYTSQMLQDATAYRTQLKGDSDSYKQQLSSLFDGIKAQLASTVSSYQYAMQTSSDSYNKLFKDTANTLTTQYIAAIKTQGDSSSQTIKDAITAFQTNDVPTLVAAFAKSLQDVMAKTQADMQNMLYGYGYRRSYTCSFSINDTTAAPTGLVGVSSVARKTGPSIVIYTATLPTALVYDYVPFAQFIPNQAEATTAQNDQAVLVTKALNRSTFTVAVERNSGSSGQDLTIGVLLVEK